MTDALTKQLGYVFKDAALLKRALTHRSNHDEHNERLEFLGDSVVNFVVAEMLYELFTQASEGDLSRWRATLINRETLATLARQFDIGPHIHVGPGEIKTRGRERLSILTCTMEAIIGAIYLDGGFAEVHVCLKRWYKPLLANLSSAASHKDPKTILQEILQKMHQALPIYAVENIEGEIHNQLFIVSCTVDKFSAKTLGKGSSRRRAEQTAAEAMLGKINHAK